MKPKTFVEKVLGAPEGAVVFRRPDLILTHDNTSSIYQTFRKMGGEKVFDPVRACARRNQWSAALAGSVTGEQRFAGRREILDMFGLGFASRTTGPAKDPRCPDSGEEYSVKLTVTALKGLTHGLNWR